MIKDKKNVNIILKKVKNTIDILLIVLLAFLSIKKGGFYKNDNLEFNLIITFIGTVYIISFYIINIFKKYIRKKNEVDEKIESNVKVKFDVIEILLLLLCFAYLLPIIFDNYSNLSDSIFEMIRYFNIYLIYVIVKKSDNKKLYINSLVFIVFIQCLLGIDGLANRYLLPFLTKLNSGYLTSDNLTRMSSTIQYANVFSLLCLLANVYIIDKIKNKSELTFQNIVEYLFIFVFTSSIILSKSRIILAILFCYLLWSFTSKSVKNKFFIGLNIWLSIIYTTILMKLLLSNTSVVYLLTFSFYMFVIILYTLRDKILNLVSKLKMFIIKNVKNKKIIWISSFFIIGIYIILALIIKVPIKLDYSVNQNYVLRNIYNLNEKETNEISIKIKKEYEDSRYKIEIFEVNNNFESTLLQTYNYYSTITDSFKFEYLPKEDFEYLMIKVTCEKNSIQVLEILLNNKNNYIDYLLLPTDIMYRLEESLNMDSSFKGRLSFVKDSFTLIKFNVKNFIIGLGGEGFKNTYQIIKSSNYFSTEVHNVYLQIFVESGVIGFITFIALIIVAFKTSKFDTIKLLLVIFCITSLSDLNFSYMFTMAVFAILLALLRKNDNIKNNIIENNDKRNNKFLQIFEFLKVAFVGIYGVFLVIILVKSNIAYHINVPNLSDSNVTFEQIVNSVQRYEKKVKLAPYEITYRYNLHLEYEKYFEMIKSYLEKNNDKTSNFYETEYKKVVQIMEKNLLEIQKNDKYDDEVLLKVAENIIEYIEVFVDEKYNIDKEIGYSFYLNIILKNINCISNFKYNNEANEAAKILSEYCYNKLIQINLEYESEIITKYIDIFNEKNNK